MSHLGSHKKQNIHNIKKTLWVTTGFKQRLFIQKGSCFASKDLWYEKGERKGRI